MVKIWSKISVFRLFIFLLGLYCCQVNDGIDCLQLTSPIYWDKTYLLWYIYYLIFLLSGISIFETVSFCNNISDCLPLVILYNINRYTLWKTQISLWHFHFVYFIFTALIKCFDKNQLGWERVFCTLNFRLYSWKPWWQRLQVSPHIHSQ